jgi:CheY-like chemotaxis protein
VSERVLVKAGYHLLSAAGEEAAVLMARKRIPNLILLDMMLPSLDGLGVLRALKRDCQTANIPVIVLTVQGQKDEAKLKREGLAGYFTKSESLLENHFDTLLRVVETVLGKQQTDGPAAEISAPVC